MARSKSPAFSKQRDAASNNSTSNELLNSTGAQTEATQPESRKVLGMVKSDSRPNVVPINLEDEIRRRAYELSEQRGFSAGHETEDWLSAEREVLQRYRQQSA